eukprot:gene37013-49942_t
MGRGPRRLTASGLLLQGVFPMRPMVVARELRDNDDNLRSTPAGGNMKHFILEPGMRSSIGGAFYPTGYSMVMFPNAEDAHRIGHRLIEQGISGDEVYLLPAHT